MSYSVDARRPSDCMPPEDWDLIFDAVAWRLREIARDAMAAPARTAVEDCVQSLDMLHATFLQERDYVRRIELELRQTRASLKAAQAELAKAQVGAICVERAPGVVFQTQA